MYIIFSLQRLTFDHSLLRELVAELPFTLMHPKPEEQYFDRPSSSSGSHKSESLAPQNTVLAAGALAVGGKENGDGDVLIDTNLIQLDT